RIHGAALSGELEERGAERFLADDRHGAAADGPVLRRQLTRPHEVPPGRLAAPALVEPPCERPLGARELALGRREQLMLAHLRVWHGALAFVPPGAGQVEIRALGRYLGSGW